MIFSVNKKNELSSREKQVLLLVADGQTNKWIAAELGLSPITIKNHVANFMIKLDAANRTNAVYKYFIERKQK